jgi:hypothetical protein
MPNATIRAIKIKWVIYCCVFVILLPAILHFVLVRKQAHFHSVLVTTGRGSWYSPTFESALASLSPKDRETTIRAYMWEPKGRKVFILIRGNGACVLQLNHQTVLRKAQTEVASSVVVFPQGSIDLKLDVQSEPSKTGQPLKMLWSSNYVNVDNPTAEDFYNREISRSTAMTDRIARTSGVIARLGAVLLILWILFYLWNPDLSPLISNRLLLAGLIVMFVLRFAGMGYQMQEFIHPDETMYGRMIEEIHAGQLAPSQFLYTTGYFKITSWLQDLAGWMMNQEVLQNLIQRLVSVLASGFTCLLVFVIAHQVFCQRIALLATFFFGFSFISIEIAHVGIVESSLLFFFLLALLKIVILSEQPSLKNFAIAGFFAGVAVAIKQTAAIIVIPFLIAAIFYHGRGLTVRRCLIGILISGCAAFAGFLILSPGSVFDFSRFYRYQLVESRSMQGKTQTRLFFLGDQARFGLLALQSLRGGVGIPMMIAAVPGMVLCWKKSREAFWLLLPPAIVYFFMIGRAPVIPDHYILLFCPFVAWFAAVAVDWLGSKFTNIQKPLLIGVALILLVPSLLNVWTLEKLMQRVDTRRQAEKWCYENIPENSRVFYEIFGPRFLIPAFENRPISLFRRPSWKQVKESQIGQTPAYFVEDSITSNVFSSSPESFEHQLKWFKALKTDGKLIKEFTGYQFRLLNPVIQIYEIPGTKTSAEKAVQ